MIAVQPNIQHITKPAVLQAHNTINVVTALQSELAVLQAKIAAYYEEEIIVRGDKIMMQEYCGFFGINGARQKR